MPWYDEHVAYGEGVRRPYLAAVGLEVHRVMALLDDAGLPQAVVQNYHSLDEFLSDAESADESPLGVSSVDEFRAPELNIEHVEAAIDYARDHSDEIDAIQQEQAELDDATLQPAEEAHERIQALELEFFEVDSHLEYDGGEAVVHFDIE